MKIYGQLAKFQQSLRKVDKDSKGYGYNYASLDHIVETIAPKLQENELSYMHTFDGLDIICTLFNLEGEKIESRLTMPQETMKGMNLNQSMGSSITYARRYTLTAILGLVTDEDTDGVTDTPKTNKIPSQGQNTAPQEDKKKWFNLQTIDGDAIEKNHKYILDNYAKGFTSSQIIKALEGAGYTIHSTVVKTIESMANDKYEEIDLEEVPF